MDIGLLEIGFIVVFSTLFVAWWFIETRLLAGVVTLMREWSIFLLSGVVSAQVLVHWIPHEYHQLIDRELFNLAGMHINLHFLVNEVFMVYFFGVAAKELSEAILKPGGDLRGIKALVPIVGCIGGIVVPVLIFFLLAEEEDKKAWAVPSATDIAIAWLGARIIWKEGSAPIAFLLALAIGDDFIGMGIIATFYPQGELSPVALLWVVSGIFTTFLMKKKAVKYPLFIRWQPYMIPGILAWWGLHEAGLHPALALVFVVPFMPMKGRDEGIFAFHEDEHQHDTVNRFEHAVKPFVDVFLFFFGLVNAGVYWWGADEGWTSGSTAVLVALLVGKTVGIVSSVMLTKFVYFKVFGKKIGEEFNWKVLLVVSLFAGVGFTVAVFVAEAAGDFPALKLGALASIVALPLGVLVAKALGVGDRKAKRVDF